MLKHWANVMGTKFNRFAKWFVPQKKKAHIAVFILSIMMIPGALTALQPIDMESYEMESPELTAQTIINDEFSNSETRAHYQTHVANLIESKPAKTRLRQ